MKAEKNRCARNCFECPICLCTLTVLSGQLPDQSGTHYLSCSFCKWDSYTEANLKFERPTGLASQLQKMEEEKDEWLFTEFEALREYFESVVRTNSYLYSLAPISQQRSTGSAGFVRHSLTMSTSSILSSMPSISSLSSKRSSSGNGWKDSVGPYETSMTLFEEDAEYPLADPSSVSTLRQRLRQLQNQPVATYSLVPQRLRLRTKKSRTCAECDECVIKSEQKTQTTKFRIKQMARDRIPSISVCEPVLFLDSDRIKVEMQISNPLDELLDVELHSPQDPETAVEFSNPKFTLPQRFFLLLIS